MNDDDVTLGEVARSVSRLETQVTNQGKDINEIKTALAGQAVKVGVVWAGLGVGGAAFVTALVALVFNIQHS